MTTKDKVTRKNKLLKMVIAVGVATVLALSVSGITSCGSGCNNEVLPTQLATPTNLNASTSTKKLTWTGDTNASGYKVYRKLSTATSYSEYATVSCEYSLLGLGAGTYELFVKAIGDGAQYTDSKSSQTITYVVSDELAVSEYAAVQVNKFIAKFANITDEILGDLGTDLPITEHTNNILRANTRQAVDAAYNAGVLACDAKILENAKSAAIAQIMLYRSDENFTTNAAEWNNALEATLIAINYATTVNDVKTALVNGKVALDLIENDTQAVIFITIQILAVIDEQRGGKIGELKVQWGETVTVGQMEEVCEFANYIFEGFYEDFACTNEITDGKTFTSAIEQVVIIYAKLADKSNFTTAGTYTWWVNNSRISESQNVTDGMLVWNDGKGDRDSSINTGNSSSFKFENKNAVLTIKFNLKAGQKFSVTANAKAGLDSDTSFGFFATNATPVSAKQLVLDNDEVTLTDCEKIDMDSNVDSDYADFVVEYEATANGEVVIQIKCIKIIVLIKTLTLVVSDDA